MRSFLNHPQKNIFILGWLIWTLTAWLSVGVHHPDEHYQILEFANYRLGNIPAETLPWEFAARIRPTIQPVMTMFIMKICHLVGLTSPFFIVFILRCLSAWAAWCICVLICLKTEEHFNAFGKKIWPYVLMFTWFVPYLMVRFSSENWSAICFFAGLVLLINRTGQRRWTSIFWAGLFLGFGFYFRFQIAFSILGLGLWLLYQKEKMQFWVPLILGGLVALGINIYSDYWFYQELAISPYQYFTANIVEGVASTFGVSPWYQYSLDFINKGVPPVSILLFVAFLFGIWKHKLSVMTWIFVPFLLGHIVVPHKEFRFLYPMVIPFLYLSTQGLMYIDEKWKDKKWWKPSLKFFIGTNILLLAYRSIAPAQEMPLYYKHAYQSAKTQTELVTIRYSLYKDGLTNIQFYKSPKIHERIVADTAAFLEYLEKEKPDTVWLFLRQMNFNIEVPGYKKEREYTHIPLAFIPPNFNNWQDRSNIFSFWKFYKIESGHKKTDL